MVMRCAYCREEAEETLLTYDRSEVCPSCADEHYISCEDCGDFVRHGDEITVERNRSVCPSCADDYEECYDCRELVEDYAVTHDGDNICESCQDNYSRCSSCDNRVHHDDEYLTHDDDAICPSCQYDYYICDSCDRLFDEDETGGMVAGDDAICPSCSNHYRYCDHCGRIEHRDNINPVESIEEYYCDDCYDDSRGRRHDYSYRPYPNFHGDGPRFYGTEIEVKGNEFSPKAMSVLNDGDESEPKAYGKYDSSIEGGFEIVSHPATLEAHLNEFRWEEAMEILISEGYKSHQAGTCGLHVHISRDAFEGEKAIAKLILLIENHWEKWLKFSRRTESQMERWARRYNTKCYDECLSKVRYPEDRYYAVNLNPRNTVELRFFRGTLKYNTFVATLKVVDRLVNLVNKLTLEQIINLKFEEIVQFGDENVNQYLQERDLYVGEEIEDPMTWEVNEEEEETKEEAVEVGGVKWLVQPLPDTVTDEDYFMFPNDEVFTVAEINEYLRSVTAFPMLIEEAVMYRQMGCCFYNPSTGARTLLSRLRYVVPIQEEVAV